MSEEENKEKLKARIENLIKELEDVLSECSQEDILRFFSIVSSYNTKYLQRNSRKMAEARMANLDKAHKASELSPKSKPARSRNMDTARLSRLSAMIVRKLGREPMPGDLVEFREKSYVFGRLENGELGVSVVDRKTDLVTAALLWIDGKLVRKMFQ